MTINYDKFPTYMASSSAFTPGAAPTDVFTLTGSATKNIYILKMGLTSLQTTEGVNAWYLSKRSAANAGGTSAAATAIPLQSGQPAATATALQYTANPTAGTAVGNIWAGWISSPEAAVAAVGPDVLTIDFETMLGQPLALLSTSEVIAWNFGGAALPAGLSVLAWVLWAESSKT